MGVLGERQNSAKVVQNGAHLTGMDSPPEDSRIESPLKKTLVYFVGSVPVMAAGGDSERIPRIAVFSSGPTSVYPLVPNSSASSASGTNPPSLAQPKCDGDVVIQSISTGNGNGCRELLELFQMQLALIRANLLEELMAVQDRLQAVREYAESVSLSVQIRMAVAEIGLRFQRKAGQILHELPLRGGDRRSKSRAETLKLEKLGISRNQSFRWQQVAAVPEALFAEYVRICKLFNKEMTAASLLRFASRQVERSLSERVGRIKNGMTRVRSELLDLVNRHKSFGCISIDPP